MGGVDAHLGNWVEANENGCEANWSSGLVRNTNLLALDVAAPAGVNRLVVAMTWDEPTASTGIDRAITYDLDLSAGHGVDCDPGTSACGEFASQSTLDNVEYPTIDQPCRTPNRRRKPQLPSSRRRAHPTSAWASSARVRRRTFPDER